VPAPLKTGTTTDTRGALTVGAPRD
jgi:hypothetical protein